MVLKPIPGLVRKTLGFPEPSSWGLGVHRGMILILRRLPEAGVSKDEYVLDWR
jgi:hypothetical protein